MTPQRQRMTNDMTVRGLARSTMASYLRSVTRLARYYRRSPDQISAREVRDFLVFLQQHEGLHRGTCNTIRHGVRCFYRITLDRPDPHFYVPGAKVPSTLPQSINHDELVRLFTVTTDLRHRAVLMAAYAAGLRASELGRLQVIDIDSARMCLRVDQGKGNKDRYVPRSPRLLEQLREYWRRDRPQRWLFPTRLLDRPMSRQTPARIYQGAKDRAHIRKPGGIHALRHCYAIELLEAGVALPVIQRRCRHLPGDASALGTTAPCRQCAGELSHRCTRRIQGVLRPLRIVRRSGRRSACAVAHSGRISGVETLRIHVSDTGHEAPDWCNPKDRPRTQGPRPSRDAGACRGR